MGKWLLERGYGQARMESFQSQKDARDRDEFHKLSAAMQEELNKENRLVSQARSEKQKLVRCILRQVSGLIELSRILKVPETGL